MVVVQTQRFTDWLRGLRDKDARGRIARRIERLAAGNPGDAEPVGEGVNEMRIHVGPGYRVYYVRRGDDLAILLCGGEKKSQARDVQTAKELARNL